MDTIDNMYENSNDDTHSNLSNRQISSRYINTSNINQNTNQNMHHNNNNNNTNTNNNYHHNNNTNENQKITTPNSARGKNQRGPSLFRKQLGVNNMSGDGNRGNTRGDSVFSDGSYATTVYTEETVELREGEKIRALRKKNSKKMKHRRELSFKKKSISENNNNNANIFKTASNMTVQNINNPKMTPIASNGSNGNGSGGVVNNNTSEKSGLSKQLKNYYGSPIMDPNQPKIRESIDMDSEKNINGNFNLGGGGGGGARGSIGGDSAAPPLDRESIIVKKSVLTLRQRTQFPQKQIRVKLYLPRKPDDEDPQQIILFINPGATMGFVKQFLEDSYPHRYILIFDFFILYFIFYIFIFCGAVGVATTDSFFFLSNVIVS